MQMRPCSGVMRTIVGGPGGTSGENETMFDSGLRSPPRRTDTTAYASEAGSFPPAKSGASGSRYTSSRRACAPRSPPPAALDALASRRTRLARAGRWRPRAAPWSRAPVSGGRGAREPGSRRHQRGRGLDRAIDLDGREVAERVAVHQPVGVREREDDVRSLLLDCQVRDRVRSARQRRLGVALLAAGDGDRNQEEDERSAPSRGRNGTDPRRGPDPRGRRGRRRPRSRWRGPRSRARRTKSPRGGARGSCAAGGRRCSRARG